MQEELEKWFLKYCGQVGLIAVDELIPLTRGRCSGFEFLGCGFGEGYDSGLQQLCGIVSFVDS